MYAYDEFDDALVRERATQFRDQVARRLSGDLTEEQFKPLRLMNGLYLQLHAYMLRVAIPYGTLSSRQMRRLARIARDYDKGYGHFTTRQNIQFNWPALIDVPDILDELAEVEMHAIQTSGNCIRNVTTDQYAGAAADELADPRVWCELIRQWSTFHPEFSFLPRKFKIAVSAAQTDRAAIRVHDIGLRYYENEAGERGFEVIVGGGLGRTPYIGATIREFLPEASLLSYLEAILRVYNLQGRRDNAYKARIKILTHALGAEAFAALVEDEWSKIDRPRYDPPAEEIERIAARFAPPPAAKATAHPRGAAAAANAQDAASAPAEPEFQRWRARCVKAHKAPGRAIVDISLKAIGAAPGDASADQMDAVADLAERFAEGEIRVTHEQNLVLPHARETGLAAIWRGLRAAGLATANVGLASDIIACPGLDYCSLANTRSIPIAQRVAARFAEPESAEDVGPLKIKISGCINACGHHHVGDIGILGVDKKGEEFYQLTLGGSPNEAAAIGEIAGRGLSADQVIDAVDSLIARYRRERIEGENFLETYRRVGAEPFKEALYAQT